MMVLLARTARGVSLFYAPMRRTIQETSHRESELNGIAIERMKNKPSTRALPTAEMELKGMRAWLVRGGPRDEAGNFHLLSRLVGRS